MAENASRGSKNEGPLDLLPSAESTHVVRRTRRGDRHEFQNHLVELLNSPVAKASLSLNISCCATEGVASDGVCATLLLQAPHQIAPDTLDDVPLVVEKSGDRFQQRLQPHATITLPHQLPIGKTDLSRRRSHTAQLFLLLGALARSRFNAFK